MNIIVTGSIAYDYLMRFPGKFREHILADSLEQVSLSFLVEDMTRHWGGVAANIAYSMARLGLQPYLMGTAGRDFEPYRARLNAIGVDTSSVQQHDDLFTASFFCNTDEENNQIASFYSGAMQRASNYPLASVKVQPDLVIVSPNDPQAMTNYTDECRQQGYRFVYDPSQQIARMNGDTLMHDMQGAALMIINEYEATMVQNKTGLSFDELRSHVEMLVITHGADGSEIFTNGDTIQVPAFAPTELLDPTGAGDAFRAGFITGLVYGFSLKTCGALGAMSATYTLEKIGPQGQDYTRPSFVRRLRAVYDDGGELDRLLRGIETTS